MSDCDELKLARIIDAAGGIHGRVRMQKIVYLLKAMGYELPFDDFRIYQQGPFSRALANAADVLTGTEITEETRNVLRTTEYGEPVVEYSYKVRQEPKEIAALIREHFDIEGPPGRPQLDEVVGELNKCDRKALETAATRLYLEREDGLAGQTLEDELQRLKGHLGSDSFTNANELLATLKQKKWI